MRTLYLIVCIFAICDAQDLKRNCGNLEIPNHWEVTNCIFDGSDSFHSERVLCHCEGCPQLLVNLKCAVNSTGKNYWEEVNDSSVECHNCRGKLRTSCRPEQATREFRCDERSNKTSGDNTTCSCRNNCREIVLTCGYNDYDRYHWSYAHGPCTGGILDGSKVFVSYDQGLHEFTCKPGWELEGSTWATCKDGVLNHAANSLYPPKCTQKTASSTETERQHETSTTINYNNKPQQEIISQPSNRDFSILVMLVILVLIVIVLHVILYRKLGKNLNKSGDSSQVSLEYMFRPTQRDDNRAQQTNNETLNNSANTCIDEVRDSQNNSPQGQNATFMTENDYVNSAHGIMSGNENDESVTQGVTTEVEVYSTPWE